MNDDQMDQFFKCPVCGFPGLLEEPRTVDGGGSYEICPSCGFEFGVTDDDKGFTYKEWRSEWIERGAHWWSDSDEPPSGWRASDYVPEDDATE